MTDQLIEAEVLPVIIPLAELEKINATDLALTQLRDKAIELQAVGVPHRAAYEEIHALTMVAVKVRTGALDIAKSLAAPHKERYDAIMEEGKRIGQHAKESEALVRPLKEAWEAEQIRLKDEAAKAEAAKIAARIDSLYAIGATFNGLTFDVFGVLIDAIEAKALPDAEFADLYQSAVGAYCKEKNRLELIEIEKQAEAARLEIQRLNQQKESERLQAVADEQQRQQRELQARQDEFDRKEREAENARLQAAADEQKRIDDSRKADEALRQSFQDKADEDQRARLQHKAETEQKRADKERTKRLAPSLKSLHNFLIRVKVAGPEIISLEPEATEIYDRFFSGFGELVENGLKEIKAL